jgi:hypothetical protein
VADCLIYKMLLFHDLHFATKVPEDGAEENSNDGCENEPNSIVRRVPPV